MHLARQAARPGSFGALSGYPSRHDLALPAAAAPNAPAKLFQQHFKDLTFNARQALAVKFER
jgi:hypothetical protein